MQDKFLTFALVPDNFYQHFKADDTFLDGPTEKRKSDYSKKTYTSEVHFAETLENNVTLMCCYVYVKITRDKYGECKSPTEWRFVLGADYNCQTVRQPQWLVFGIANLRNFKPSHKQSLKIYLFYFIWK
jgi:hypothetical protein